MNLRRYLLSNVFRAPDDAAAGSSPPAVVTAGAPAAGADVATAPAAASAPAEATPAPAPAAEAPAAPEAKPAEAPGSLLGEAQAKPQEPGKEGDKAPEAKAGEQPPAEAKPQEQPAEIKPEVKPEDKAAEVPPPEPRVYEAFTLPEGVQLAEPQLKEFTAILDDAKLTHQERAQKLVDLYVTEATRMRDELQTHQREVWTQTNQRWIDEIRADEEIGGNRMETSLQIAAAGRDALFRKEDGTLDTEGLAAFKQMLDYTGAGNTLPMIRAFYRAGQRFAEASPVPANTTAAGGTPRSRAERWYGGKGNGAGA